MAHKTLSFLSLLYLLSTAVSAATVVLKLQPTNLLPNPNTLPPSTHATITTPDGHILQSSLRKDNTIVFNDISSVGSHLLKIYSKDYTFASYRLDTTVSPASAAAPAASEQSSSVVISLAAQTFPGTQWSDTGLSLLPQQSSPESTTSRSVSTLTFTPKVLAAKSFYEARPAFSPVSLLKNPMLLLGIVALAFTFGMPKLMENMDPDMRAEYEEMQKKGPTAAIGRAMQGGGAGSGSDNFDLAGYLAGQGRGGGAESLRERKK